MEILQIKNLSFSYPNSNKNALDNVNLSISEGELNVIFGESGCGKSTLLKLIKKEIAPYGKINGSITYNGHNIDEIDKKISAKEIGYVTQNPDSQIVTDKVWHELAFGLESLGYESSVIRRKVAEITSYFGIEGWYNKNTFELSGGQKQLLNLASVMVMNPKLLLLDEPTAQLDPISANNFINTLIKINRDLGVTILLVEHRLDEILPISDKVILLENGSVKFSTTAKDIANYFDKGQNNNMFKALPSSLKIFLELGGSGTPALTVRECKNFITSNFSNRIKAIEKNDYVHSNNEKVRLKNVYFRYEKELDDILCDVSFTVYENEHFCILGGNGSGKSTTLNIIANLLKSYSGKVYIDGKPTTKLSQKELYKNNIALLPQNPQSLFIEDNVFDDLYEAFKYDSSLKTNAKEKIDNICLKLNINHLLNMHPYDLSGGEIQKVALAKLLLLEPKILLLDEPTKGIDANMKYEIGAILNKLKQSGITIITVTHDIEFAAQFADRCGLYFDSNLISIDTPNNFFSKNSFYTTSASKISRDFFENTILCEDVVKLCNINKGVLQNEK